MTRLAAVVRGMRQRGGTTILILAVALVATAAAATGPIYYQAARTSILRDTVATTSFIGRGYEANETGAVPGLLGQLAPAVRKASLTKASVASPDVGCSHRPSTRSRRPCRSRSSRRRSRWSGGAGCAGSSVSAAACPRPGTSASSAAAGRPGRLAHRPAADLRRLGAFTITGLYRPPDQNRGYWFGRGSIYFSTSTSLLRRAMRRRDVHPPRHSGARAARPAGQPRWWTTCCAGRGSPVTRSPQLAAAMTAFSDATVLRQPAGAGQSPASRPRCRRSSPAGAPWPCRSC